MTRNQMQAKHLKPRSGSIVRAMRGFWSRFIASKQPESPCLQLLKQHRQARPMLLDEPVRGSKPYQIGCIVLGYLPPAETKSARNPTKK
jgi:hypothetical protein